MTEIFSEDFIDAHGVENIKNFKTNSGKLLLGPCLTLKNTIYNLSLYMCPKFNQKKLYEAEKGRSEKNMRLQLPITKYRKSKSLVDILSSDYTPYSTVGIAFLTSI